VTAVSIGILLAVMSIVVVLWWWHDSDATELGTVSERWLAEHRVHDRHDVVR
jgi:hypothetical protein